MKLQHEIFCRKLGRCKPYVNIAKWTEIVLLSITTTQTTTADVLTAMGLRYSAPTSFSRATVSGSLSELVNIKEGTECSKYSQMFILTNHFSDKFNKL